MIVVTDACLSVLASGESPISARVLINYALPMKKVHSYLQFTFSLLETAVFDTIKVILMIVCIHACLSLLLLMSFLKKLNGLCTWIPFEFSIISCFLAGNIYEAYCNLFGSRFFFKHVFISLMFIMGSAF